MKNTQKKNLLCHQLSLERRCQAARHARKNRLEINKNWTQAICRIETENSHRLVDVQRLDNGMTICTEYTGCLLHT
jgi:hypothetical protein